ncbi:MAG: sulfatase [Verrucomicrobiota bacterium]
MKQLNDYNLQRKFAEFSKNLWQLNWFKFPIFSTMKFLSLLLGFMAFSLSVDASVKPNIVFILVDDMPWWGTSVEQMEGEPRSTSQFRVTPNIERIAARGMTFSNAYAAAGMCAPSRCSIQTGLSPARHHFSGNSNFGDAAPQEVFYEAKRKDRDRMLIEPSPIGTLRDEFLTIGEALQSAGYATAHLGKWHVYGGGPERHGYNVSDGETSNTEGSPKKSEIDPADPKRIFSMTEKALGFIQEQADAGKPFYVQVSHYAEHSKQMSLPESLEFMLNREAVASIESTGAQKEASTHGAAVLDMDTAIGMILDRLDALGIRDETYVFIMSDNGKNLYNGTDSILRGDKWWLWEAGIRVPFMVEGPGVPAGSRSGENVVGYDLLPTFVDIAGGNTASPEAQFDGRSLIPLLKNQPAKEWSERSIYFHYPHMRNSTPHSVIIKGEYKLYMFYEIPEQPQLFRLSQDLGEEVNLASSMPEKAQSMQAELASYLDRVGAFLPKQNPDADPELVPFDPESSMPPLSRRLAKTKDK